MSEPVETRPELTISDKIIAVLILILILILFLAFIGSAVALVVGAALSGYDEPCITPHRGGCA